MPIDWMSALGRSRPDEASSGPYFAKANYCALLPLVVIASNGRFQPFYDIGAQCSMGDV